MARICCLAAVDTEDIPRLRAALSAAGELEPAIPTHLGIGTLRKIMPDVLIADIDRVEVDPLETLRQLRFVLPDTIIVVYTGSTRLSWGRACHLAGANCLLWKESLESQLVFGLQQAIRTGCFTDPHFVA